MTVFYRLFQLKKNGKESEAKAAAAVFKCMNLKVKY